MQKNFENLQTEQNEGVWSALVAALGSYKMAPMHRVWVVLVLVYSVALQAQNNTPQEVRSPAGNAATNQEPSTPDSTALEFIQVVEPAYPLDAVKRKLQGLVTLKVMVSEAGDADSETVISGDPDLAQAAVDAVKKWKFRPFIRNAKPARVSVILPFDFIFVDEAIDPHPKTETGSSSASSRPASSPNVRAMKIIWVATGAERRERLRKRVNPIYPDIAKAAHIQGELALIVVISKDLAHSAA